MSFLWVRPSLPVHVGWGLPPLGQRSCLPLEELKGFIPTPLICPNSATADWGRGFRPPPLPNHSAIEAAESGRPTDDEHGDEGEFNGTRGVGLMAI